MHSNSMKALLLLGLVIVATAAAVSAASADKILLSEVKALTLHSNRLTSARRGHPIPQVCTSLFPWNLTFTWHVQASKS